MQKICRYTRLAELPDSAWHLSSTFRDPFFSAAFLSGLEEHDCVNAQKGWQPCHLALHEEDSTISAFLPLYLKNHSQGEFVFDWNWADASESAGIPYYPKLVSSIPFTPVTGPRIGYASPDKLAPLLAGLQDLAENTKASSWHLLFPDQQTSTDLLNNTQGLKLLERRDCHFVWNNQDYQSFDDFLQTFSSRKRKNIKKERRRVAEQGIHFLRLQGDAIDQQHLDDFYRFYQQTYAVRGRQPYLNPAFFQNLVTQLKEQMLLVMAYRDEQTPVGAALFMISQHSLYGRWWGGDPQIDCLHFETCYYQGIDFAIEHKLARFDPGIQGEHKLLRGFEPEQTRSLHWIRELRLQTAVEQWLLRERQHIDAYQHHAANHLPFKKG